MEGREAQATVWALAVIVGTSHAAFRVSDLERSLAFYRDVLGFREAFRLHREDGTVGLVYLRVGPNQFLELFPSRDPLTPSEGTSYAHLCLEVDDMHRTLAELRARGLPVTGEPRRGQDKNLQYWISDPDGNRIELMELAPDSPQRSAP